MHYNPKVTEEKVSLVHNKCNENCSKCKYDQICSYMMVYGNVFKFASDWTNKDRILILKHINRLKKAAKKRKMNKIA